MTRDDDIFSEALELPAAERAAFLDRACLGDAALRSRIDALLAGHEAANSFLNHPPVARPTGLVVEQPGDVIGHYKLIRKLGEGGGGVVYLADQTEPVRRQVALKVIKLGMDTREVITRFEGERQALAMMDHPDIARVFDAGTTDTGRPFFVMEFVDGVPITKFADDHRLPMAERLELFARVCHAVQHAHQKGIIHRDLKPSNILVTEHDGVATPKVIDFGIAKATQGKLTDATLATAIAQFIGTPAYMSPEQAELSSVDIDTRSDIYSLGVLLYELLTGRTPFEPKALMQAGLDEMRRQIREVDPPRPSTRLNTLEQATLATTAGHRQIAAPKLISQIQGDLDWIVMRCLEKDRTRRYDTATSLAQDLQRHLNHEPVEARPVSTAYRFRKLVRRHRLAFAAAAAITVALIAGVVVSTWQAIRANRAERAAQHEAATSLREAQRANRAERATRDEAAISKAVNDFLLQDLLRQADSHVQADARETPNPDLKVREALERAAKTVGTRFKDQPLIEAAVRQAIGDSFCGIGLYAQADPHLQRALELRRQLLGAIHVDTLKSESKLADNYAGLGKFAEAVALNTHAWQARLRILGPDHLDTLDAMADLALNDNSLGKYAEAEELLARVLAAKQRLFGPENPVTLRAMNALAMTYRFRGKFPESAAMHAQTLEIQKRVLGPDHPDALTSANNLSLTLDEQGKTAEVAVLQTEVWEARKRTLGPEHPQTLVAANNLASTYSTQGKLAEAIALHASILPVQQRLLGPENPDVVATMNNLATEQSSAGQYAPAEELFKQTLEILLRTDGPEHPRTLSTMNNLAVAYGKDRKYAEALALHMQLQAGLAKVFGPEHPNTLGSMNNLAVAYANLGKVAEAAALHERAYTAQKRVLGPDHPSTLVSLNHLANEYATLGRAAESADLRWQTLESQKRKLGPEAPATITTMANLGTALLALKRFTEAEAILRELLAFREKKFPDEWSTFNSRAALGAALAGQRKFADAEPLLISGYEGMAAREAKIPDAGKPRVAEALQRLVQSYTDAGQSEQAAAWQKKLDERAAAAKSPASPPPPPKP